MVWRETYLTGDIYRSLIALICILSILLIPTVSLNGLVILAVATKRQLRTNSNKLLACLAGTDLLAGLVVIPIAIAVNVKRAFEIGPFCELEKAHVVVFWVQSIATLTFLFLISGDRYIAKKRLQAGQLSPQEAKELKKDVNNKATVTLSLILGTLVLTNLPLITVASIQAFTNFFESGTKMALISWTDCAAVFNSLFNPIIYCWRNQNLRKALLELRLSRVPPTSRVFTSGYVNTETILHFFNVEYAFSTSELFHSKGFLFGMVWRESYLTGDLYRSLIALICILSILLIPTVSLNGLVILAVATKRQLRTNSNKLLACLARTDLLAGLVVIPIAIAVNVKRAFEIGPFCELEKAHVVVFWVQSIATLTFLFLISGDRYIARQKKRLQAGQLSPQEAKELKKDINNKATVTLSLILGTLVLTYLPLITVASIQAFTNFFESGTKMALISWTDCAAVFNSLFNPIIYCWRNQNLRKALLEVIHREKRENTPSVSKIQPSISKTFKESAPNQEAVLLLGEHSISCAYLCTYLGGMVWRESYLTGDIYRSLIALICILSILLIPTVSLNGLVILAVATKRQLRTNSNKLLACLAGTDLLAGLVVIPIAIAVNVKR
ncbi:unnamed protein product, partial [Pocillopora meandrina]